MSLRAGGMITAQRYDIIDVRTMNCKRTWDNGFANNAYIRGAGRNKKRLPMKTKYLLGALAALSLLTVFSCTKENNQTPEPETSTLSIKASKDVIGTKALELNGNTLNAMWDGSESVSVFKNDTQIGVLTPDLTTLVDPAKLSCTLSGPFSTIPADGDELTLYLNGNNYSGQDGTLGFIAGNCDYAVATLHVTGVHNGQIESTEGRAAFENQQAIVKFTLRDKADDAMLLRPSALTVNDGTGDIATVTLSTPADTYATNGSDGVLYVAIPPVSGKTLTLTATVGEDTYSYTRSAVTFLQGQYYTFLAKMIKQNTVDLSTKTGNYEAQDGDILTGELNGAYKLTIPDGATVTLAGMTHHAALFNSGIECLGSATIILAAGSVNDVTGGYDTVQFGIGMTGNGVFTLTIEGTGTLKASSGNWLPGIGGTSEGHHIVINGGNITTTGGYGGPGIGAMYEGASCGDITINGGTINAIGGDTAAGIGLGFNSFKCGHIIFNGGDVTVTGGKNAIGVGVPSYISGSGRCRRISFSGGTVKVTGGIKTSDDYSIYVDNKDVGSQINDSPYYYPAQ